MNILIHRNLPPERIASFKREFPGHEIKVVPSAESIDPYWNWVEAMHGNPNPGMVLEKADNLKWLQLLSSGIDEYASLQDSNIRLTSAHGIHAPVIAQHLLMMILLLERKLWYFQSTQSKHQWDRQARLPGLLRDRTIGMIGYGAIAGQLVKLLKPFDISIKAVTRDFPQSTPANVSLHGPESTEDVLAEADHLLIVLPLTPETRHFMSRERFAAMKQGACFHNVGRGEIVDEAALIEFLQSGHLGGAAIDVFEKEPLDPKSPLWDFPNCIVTPHIAGHHSGLDLDTLDLFAENLKRLESGERLINEANWTRGY